jgi:hypothetical protein
MLRPIPALVTFLLMTAWGAGLPALATDWVVDPSGGGDFTTIMAAILAAEDGDTIEVLAGTYVEDLDFLGKNIRIHARSGPEATILTRSARDVRASHLVTFANGEGPGATLEGFTLVAAAGPYVDSLGGTGGGAIGCYGSSPQILDCIIRENEAEYGAGLLVIDSHPLVAGCTFIENVAAISGSAISGPNSAPTIRDCRFEHNQALSGSGTVQLGIAGEILDCEFVSNYAYSGGAISCPYGAANLTIKGCYFQSNQATGDHGGAIRIHEASPTIEFCTFADNRAAVAGGAIMMLDGGMAEIRQCVFYSNLAVRSGAHLAILYGSHPRIENCILAEALGGYGVFVDSAQPTFACNCFWSNRPLNFLNFDDPSGTGGNITEDPLFCNAFDYDFTIDARSPCAEENNPGCGRIGRLGVGCGLIRCNCISWGELRTRFDPQR